MGGSIIPANSGAAWLDRSQICPNPEVRDFHPRLGPWEGGTNVTIDGANLGKTFADIRTGITVKKKKITHKIEFNSIKFNCLDISFDWLNLTNLIGLKNTIEIEFYNN